METSQNVPTHLLKLNCSVWNLKNGGAIMAGEDFKREFTANLSADVEGYCRLIGDDELYYGICNKPYIHILTH